MLGSVNSEILWDANTLKHIAGMPHDNGQLTPSALPAPGRRGNPRGDPATDRGTLRPRHAHQSGRRSPETLSRTVLTPLVFHSRAMPCSECPTSTAASASRGSVASDGDLALPHFRRTSRPATTIRRLLRRLFRRRGSSAGGGSRSPGLTGVEVRWGIHSVRPSLRFRVRPAAGFDQAVVRAAGEAELVDVGLPVVGPPAVRRGGLGSRYPATVQPGRV